ncbi:MAG TPA: hypothetical protein VFD36_16540 [Kofleriaceae bacterium]|nr:hypothetical protein [Kofleriaceae bacterium]
MTRAAPWTSCGCLAAWAASWALLCTGCPPENHRPPAPRYTVEKPARPDPPPAPPPAPHHASHEHPHGAHPHPRSAHHHHPHPHPHLAGQNGHHHPY